MRSTARVFAALSLTMILGLIPPWTWAASLVTTDPVTVGAFQTGATILGFDSLPANGGGGLGGIPGFPIQPGSQLTDQFDSSGILFSSTGGPVAVVSVEGLNESDAKSPFNIIGGSEPGNPLPTIDYSAPIMVTFVLPNTTTPALTSRVGAWNDPTGSRILLSVFDINGNVLESIEADQGFFVGIEHAEIASAVFSWVETQSIQGFSLDDVTFSPVTPIPIPAAIWLFGAGIVSLWLSWSAATQ